MGMRYPQSGTWSATIIAASGLTVDDSGQAYWSLRTLAPHCKCRCRDALATLGCRLRKDFQPAARSRLTLSRDRWAACAGLLVSIDVSGRDYATSTWGCQAWTHNILLLAASDRGRSRVGTGWLLGSRWVPGGRRLLGGSGP